MGSAVMTAEMVIEAMEDRRIKLIDGPVAEGAVLAAVEAKMGSSLEMIAQRVEEARGIKKLSE
jgi:dihydroxyacetone kinase DhaKLM complex PTS-EIIA-like component DhaM